MQLSIHYYVLSLSEQKSRLYEGFRDKLIYIQNTNFPFESFIEAGSFVSPVAKETLLKEFFRQTDQHFGLYYEQDPLRLVVVGEKSNLAIFKALTIFQGVLIGMVDGDYTATSPHDLGKIVWSVVKEAMADTNKYAMRDLAKATKEKKIVSGIGAVGKTAGTETGSILYVEEDYHMKGSIRIADHELTISEHLIFWESMDDEVDVIIEKVLKMNGTVIFLIRGSLMKLDRIALILRG